MVECNTASHLEQILQYCITVVTWFCNTELDCLRTFLIMRCLLLLDEEERLDKDGLLVEVALSADMVAVPVGRQGR